MNNHETDSRYVPYHIESFLDFLEYETAKRKYTKEHIEWLKSIPYKEYLETPHWALLKKCILGRHGRACHICKKSHVEVHIHHLTYENRGQENINELACLCSECHAKVHGKYDSTLE